MTCMGSAAFGLCQTAFSKKPVGTGDNRQIIHNEVKSLRLSANLSQRTTHFHPICRDIRHLGFPENRTGVWRGADGI